MATDPVDGVPFGDLQETRDFMQGLQNYKPTPQKTKTKRWDIYQVVRHLQTLTPFKELFLLQQGQKTHALLCLAAGWGPTSDFAQTAAAVRFTRDKEHQDWPLTLVLTAVDVKEG